MKRPRTYFILNLGCPKNEVDGQSLEFQLIQRGLSPSDPEEADILIVNTCGFIADARQESIDEILRLAQLKHDGTILAVTGCLSQRFRKELLAELSEVDYFFGISSPDTVADILLHQEPKHLDCTFEVSQTYQSSGGRFINPGSPYAYVKIADGCDNLCSYCAIPLIRGGYRSRPIDDVIKEVDFLLSNDIKEIILIAQETTRYGQDLARNENLEYLIKEICADDRLKWLRILYAHPARTRKSLLQIIAEENKVCSYLDLPLQHISDNMLSRMNRGITASRIKTLVSSMRNEFPEIALRTTFLLGHPGETQDNFEELSRFVEEARFENLGCFVYSEEEQTASAAMENKISSEIASERYEQLMLIQSTIAENHNRQRMGKTFQAIVDSLDSAENIYNCRLQSQSPDIDGNVRLVGYPRQLKPGDFANIKITGYDLYDLDAIIADETALRMVK
ncbi:MAG: 30S ribosomal protein S12 methylthiotransferase RimO [candidate division Zixibacteria bacterium CG_4_9_14_3_um_filter_46_8]|nr:MAG: 30S ribosomal protein S12 methylthiotransferase RimO [candidate division Zixibacteria bacterium CG_4_9_14_3_um_filter_46_8]